MQLSSGHGPPWNCITDLLFLSLSNYSNVFSLQQVYHREACLLCFEVLPLSVLTYHAWKPSGHRDWYDADCGWGYGNVDVGRLAGEGKHRKHGKQPNPPRVNLHKACQMFRCVSMFRGFVQIIS